jgi:hypothetical protein
MKFQIYGKDNKCKLVTESKSCIPGIDELKLMSKVGYKFKLDGKSISLSKLKEELKL